MLLAAGASAIRLTKGDPPTEEEIHDRTARFVNVLDTNGDATITISELADALVLAEREYDLPVEIAVNLAHDFMKLHLIFGNEITADELKSTITDFYSEVDTKGSMKLVMKAITFAEMLVYKHGVQTTFDKWDKNDDDVIDDYELVKARKFRFMGDFDTEGEDDAWNFQEYSNYVDA